MRSLDADWAPPPGAAGSVASLCSESAVDPLDGRAAEAPAGAPVLDAPAWGVEGESLSAGQSGQVARTSATIAARPAESLLLTIRSHS